MSDAFICLTSAAELLPAVRRSARAFTLTVECCGAVADVDLVVRAVRAGRDRATEVIGVLPTGHFLTVVVPPADSPVGGVAVVETGRVVEFLHDGLRSTLEVGAVEEYLRWQEHVLLWGAPAPVDCGPFAEHPRLHDLPRSVREQIASLLADNKMITAVKVLREATPGLGLSEAAAVIGALRI